jgi:hypothetical protein
MRLNPLGEELGCGVPFCSPVRGSCSRLREWLESLDQVGKTFVLEWEAVSHLHCYGQKLACKAEKQVLEFFKLANRSFERRIAICIPFPPPTNWITLSKEAYQVGRDTPAHSHHFDRSPEDTDEPVECVFIVLAPIVAIVA